MILIAKTYWGGAPYHFRRAPRDGDVEPLLLRAADAREFQGLYWTPRNEPKPAVAVVCMHPRADFGRHYTFPRLVEAGIGCLGANTRNPNNDTDTVHEQIVLDVAACIRYLRERRGARRVILLGNSGGASLNALFQAQALLAPEHRIAVTPGGRPTRLPSVEMLHADGMIYVSAHKGEGRIMNECIDPAVVHESKPTESDPTLDMYDPRNGFRPPPEWCEYDAAFVSQYRAAQLERVRRLDDIARAYIAENEGAEAQHRDPGFQALPFAEQREVMRREAFERVMVIYRTMANLHYVDRHLDPSDREYGSLLSDQPDLMNHKLLGFARVCTPHAWLSTWSGLASNADMLKTLPSIQQPTLVVHAGRDREIYPRTDARAIFEAVGADDKVFEEFPQARHYFEPDLGERDAPEVERLMDLVVPWIQARFA